MTQTPTGESYLFITISNDRPKVYQDRLVDECLKKEYPERYEIIDSRTIRIRQKDPNDKNEINILRNLIQNHADKSIPKFLKFEINYY